jgi:CRP-like cAMP-binding protein
MPAAPQPSGQASNRFLAAMTREDWISACDALAPVDLPHGTDLIIPHTPIEDLFFPASGLVSLVAELLDGNRAEVGLVGRESVVGLTALLGESQTTVRAVVQMAGHGHRIGVANLRPLCHTSRGLGDLVHRHAALALLQASINAACNAVHTVERRAARWLLAVEDRVGPTFPITQEYFGQMIAARRPVVNGILKGFRAAGLIRHSRGRIAIADHPGLEAIACVCHRAEREGRARLLADSASGELASTHPTRF